MITIIVTDEGSEARTTNVDLCMCDTHISANDDLASESNCLLAYLKDDSEREPIGWDGTRLIFSGDIAGSEPVVVRRSPQMLEYQIAFVMADGEWDEVETFMAANDDAANEYAEENYSDKEWFVLNSSGKNINGGE